MGFDRLVSMDMKTLYSTVPGAIQRGLQRQLKFKDEFWQKGGNNCQVK